jgi:hypothetical protein
MTLNRFDCAKCYQDKSRNCSIYILRKSIKNKKVYVLSFSNKTIIFCTINLSLVTAANEAVYICPVVFRPRHVMNRSKHALPCAPLPRSEPA